MSEQVMAEKKLYVGMDLYYVPANLHRGRAPTEVTVTKVGRKWAEISNGMRVSIEDLRADPGNFSSPGTCWPNKESYEREVERQRAWEVLRRKFDSTWGAPEGVGINQIMNAMRSLFKDATT